MNKQYQVTLLCATGQYKPVSAIITRQQNNDVDCSRLVGVRDELKTRGIEKICAQRNWGTRELKQYNYTKIKIREYDKRKIAEAAAARYEEIKRQKYESGEWIEPKKKE